MWINRKVISQIKISLNRKVAHFAVAVTLSKLTCFLKLKGENTSSYLAGRFLIIKRHCPPWTDEEVSTKRFSINAKPQALSVTLGCCYLLVLSTLPLSTLNLPTFLRMTEQLPECRSELFHQPTTGICRWELLLSAVHSKAIWESRASAADWKVMGSMRKSCVYLALLIMFNVCNCRKDSDGSKKKSPSGDYK